MSNTFTKCFFILRPSLKSKAIPEDCVQEQIICEVFGHVILFHVI